MLDRRLDGEERKALFVEPRPFQSLSGFRTVVKRDVGKALVRSLQVALGRDGHRDG